ncbi:MAG TPA: energy transducer TonB [Steroidobacteraceae bacterium]|nr:energy transducer TonB [Steroidobacteraceae bacterium]
MTIRTLPWRRRVPTLLIATLLQALFVVAFLRGLSLAGHALPARPLLVSIITAPPVRAPLPPKLPVPNLAQAPAIPPLIAPVVVLPSVLATNATSVQSAPTFVSGPLDADEYYPMEARATFSQGHVWTRVCVYSTGDVASVALLQPSGDAQLDQAALTVAKLTRWKPAMANGKPVARCTRFRVDFSLRRSAPLLLN